MSSSTEVRPEGLAYGATFSGSQMNDNELSDIPSISHFSLQAGTTPRSPSQTTRRGSWELSTNSTAMTAGQHEGQQPVHTPYIPRNSTPPPRSVSVEGPATHSPIAHADSRLRPFRLSTSSSIFDADDTHEMVHRRQSGRVGQDTKSNETEKLSKECASIDRQSTTPSCQERKTVLPTSISDAEVLIQAASEEPATAQSPELLELHAKRLAREVEVTAAEAKAAAVEAELAWIEMRMAAAKLDPEDTLCEIEKMKVGWKGEDMETTVAASLGPKDKRAAMGGLTQEAEEKEDPSGPLHPTELEVVPESEKADHVHLSSYFDRILPLADIQELFSEFLHMLRATTLAGKLYIFLTCLMVLFAGPILHRPGHSPSSPTTTYSNLSCHPVSPPAWVMHPAAPLLSSYALSATAIALGSYRHGLVMLPPECVSTAEKQDLLNALSMAETDLRILCEWYHGAKTSAAFASSSSSNGVWHHEAVETSRLEIDDDHAYDDDDDDSWPVLDTLRHRLMVRLLDLILPMREPLETDGNLASTSSSSLPPLPIVLQRAIACEALNKYVQVAIEQIRVAHFLD